MERAQLTVVVVEYALTVEGKQVCSIRVMAAPPPIDSLPQPAARGPHTTRGKSIYCDQRSLTTDLTSGLSGISAAHQDFFGTYCDGQRWTDLSGAKLYIVCRNEVILSRMIG